MAVKILILTARIPYPVRDGGALAMSQTIEEYIALGCEVSLLAMNTSRHWVDENSLPTFYNKLVNFKTVYVKTNVNPLAAFINLFTDKSYNVERFIHKEYRIALIELLSKQTFDFIQFESIYTAPYLDIAKAHTKAKMFCRVHNIEHLIWQRLTDNEKNFLKKRYLQLLTHRLKNYELTIIQQFDLLLTISAQEAAYFQDNKLNHCYHLPFGIDTNAQLPIEYIKPEIESCYHLGSMDWAPNLEGVHWLRNEIWPLVQAINPQLFLYLAGKNMPANIVSEPDKNIIVKGEVDDIIVFSLEKNIMLVPLLAGAGIRIKIIQAMALGKTIIGTTIAFEGIGISNGENGIVADTAADFAEAINYYCLHTDKSKQIGQKAQAYVHKHYKKETIYKNWMLFYEEVL